MTTEKNPKDKIVCDCLKITERDIVHGIRTHKIKNIKDVIHLTEAGGGCTACHPALKDYLEKYGDPKEKGAS